MASFTGNWSDVFPAGTVVGVYPTGSAGTGGPARAAQVDSGTVQTDGTVTFSSLPAADTPYVAQALVGSAYRAVRFRVSDSILASGRTTGTCTTAVGSRMVAATVSTGVLAVGQRFAAAGVPNGATIREVSYPGASAMVLLSDAATAAATVSFEATAADSWRARVRQRRQASLPAPQRFLKTQSPWYARADGAPVDANSAAYLAELETVRTATDWAINRLNGWSCPVYVVPLDQPRVPVTMWNGSYPTGAPQTQTQSSSNGTFELAWRMIQGVPIPPGATAATQSDKHMAIICGNEMWGLWKAQIDGTLGWVAQGGGYMADYTSNVGIYVDDTANEPRMFKGWSATATGLPIHAGLVTPRELAEGVVNHALHLVYPYRATRTVTLATTSGSTAATSSDASWTSAGDLNASLRGTGVASGTTITAVGSTTDVTLSQNATATGSNTVTVWGGPGRFVWPAQRGDGTQDSLMPEGARIRLKSSFDLMKLVVPGNPVATRTRRIFGRAMQLFGAIITDHNGGSIAFRIEPDTSSTDVATLGLSPSLILKASTGTMWATSDLEVVDSSWRP